MLRPRLHLPPLCPTLTVTLLTLVAGCSQVEPPQTTAQPNPPATPIPASPQPVSSPIPAASPDSDPLPEALDTAMSAATIAQSAVSLDDWNLVVSRWQEAIALLEKTPSSHPKKQLANQKIDEYQRNLVYAKEQSLKPSQPKPSPQTIVASQPSQPKTQASQPPETTPPPQPDTPVSQSPATTPSPQSNPSPAISAKVALAQHLQQSDAKMYEAYWCTVCRWQEKQFGPEAYSLITTIECDPRGKNAQPELCRQAKIRAFPTWEINGQLYEGGMQLEQLANLSGYSGSRNFN